MISRGVSGGREGSDHVAVGTSQALAWLAVPQLEAHLMVTCFHQKEVIKYHSLQFTVAHPVEAFTS